MSLALLPKALRRKAKNLVNLAFLPLLLKRKHRKASVQKKAHLKRSLVWAAVSVVLRPLMKVDGDDDSSPVRGYR